MSVELVHCTSDAEALIVRMARVSNPSNADNRETAPRLLRYLVRHRHWSPFEMASMCVRIETQRDVAAQLLRHRSFSFQELSQRYAVVDPAEPPRFRRQDATNRQNSTDDLDAEVQAWIADRAALVMNNAYLAYEEMLGMGVARECARRVLPLCTPTTLYMHGTVRSWIHYLQVRLDAGTQLEHREVAQGCLRVFAEAFPVIAEAVALGGEGGDDGGS